MPAVHKAMNRTIIPLAVESGEFCNKLEILMDIRISVRILIAICTLPFLFFVLIGILQIYQDGIEGFDVTLLFALVATFIGGYLSLTGRTPGGSTGSE